MNAPVATDRKSFLPLRLRSATIVGSNNRPNTSLSTTAVTTSMSLNVKNETSNKSSSLTVGHYVLVNGLKRGFVRYIGAVQFAQGTFCGVELDEPEGKHDGQVNDVRYFQCKTNHGIFVPCDKVVLTTRERTYTTQRPLSRLKPPTMTRSMTISSSTNNNINEQIPTKTSSSTIQLPDIIPSPSTSIQPIPIIRSTANNPITLDPNDILTPTEDSKVLLHPSPIITDEPLETIDADFTDSVSLILHQLQQKEKPIYNQSRPSITISEEGTVDDDDEDEDDDDDDDIDESGPESLAESMFSEKRQSVDNLPSLTDLTKSIQTDLSFDVNENVTITKINLTDSINKIDNSNKKKSNLPTSPTVIGKRPSLSERKLSIPSSNSSTPIRKLSVSSVTPSITPRKTSLVPPKKDLLLSTKSTSLSGSQSKLNQSLSSSNSVNSSYSDLTINQQRKTKSTSTAPRGGSFSIEFRPNKKSEQNSDVFNHHSVIQEVVIQSLKSTNELLKQQYQHLLHRFDVMCISNQYFLNRNEQIKQEYGLKFSRIRTKNEELKTSIEQMKSSHQSELINLNEQNQNQIRLLKEKSEQDIAKYQEELNKLLNDKVELETRCNSLQGEVDRYMEEMANSEYADPLLRRVDILEKDRASLQAALEIRNQEFTQLRTQMNEQTFERQDQAALQKRIDMIEQRNQDLVYLLRNWQLNEKAVTIERDQLKERISQLEHDNRQLISENEILLYSLRYRSTITNDIPTTEINPISKLCYPSRAQSSSPVLARRTGHDSIKRSLSLDCIYNNR